MARNPLRLDPTRTTMIRKAFAREMRVRFKALRQVIRELVLTDDVFGLQDAPYIFNAAPRQAWKFKTSDDKLRSFNRWFKSQVDQKVLSTDYKGKPWLAKYVESSYRKGLVRAYIDSKRKEEMDKAPAYIQGSRAQFLSTSFAAPERVSKVQLLSTRTFEELNGVSAAMGQKISRILAGGIANGLGVQKLARQMDDAISSMTRTRAEMIARTEIIHAHAEGQLDAFEDLGVAEVGVMSEWSTAGDELVCPLCEELEGTVFTVEEARGLIPRHPNCRCTWIPANVGEGKEKGRATTAAAKERRIDRSIQQERPNTDLDEARDKSTWAGKDVDPETVVIDNYDPDQERDENGRWTSGGGGGGDKAGSEYTQGLKKEVEKNFLKKGNVDGFMSTDDSHPSFRMAQAVEGATDRETMMKVVKSQMDWQSSPSKAVDEWKAARALGMSEAVPQDVKAQLEQNPEMDRKTLKAFMAREEFTQAFLREKYAGQIDSEDRITLYRGVSGPQAREIQRLKKDDIDVGVHGLSSFSTDIQSARDFAFVVSKSLRGAVLEVKVPVKEVWAAPQDLSPQGFKYLNDRGEVVVRSKTGTRSARVIQASWKPTVNFSPDQERDENGRWTAGGGGSSSSEDKPKKGQPQPWQDPPSPRGSGSGKAGGFTASGKTNTSVGDLGEALLVKQLDMHSLLPPGRRQNPLDLRYDGTNEAYECKTITTEAREYKIKMKAAEVRSKKSYARKNGLKPGMIMLVLDARSKTAYAYKRAGIGNFRLNSKDWQFMGRVKV